MLATRLDRFTKESSSFYAIPNFPLRIGQEFDDYYNIKRPSRRNADFDVEGFSEFLADYLKPVIERYASSIGNERKKEIEVAIRQFQSSSLGDPDEKEATTISEKQASAETVPRAPKPGPSRTHRTPNAGFNPFSKK